MYKIFVSIDEHTNIAELANVLQIDLQLVKNAVSLYIRLGFAHKKGEEMDEAKLHHSWTEKVNSLALKRYGSRENLLTLDLNNLPDKTNSVASLHWTLPQMILKKQMGSCPLQLKVLQEGHVRELHSCLTQH
ncbi:hypothetical protein OS493_001688 [Desmophyllum pertusum]|uniref:FAM91 N-terminal domain-containing protein n=1 Tax=Desmophyllum pertusum TaxID=174260 RepID=A0A9W9Z6W8_9CNID|nr:hypothetical protein OS493_001688 [Desmophyllum pertusum]